MSKEKGFTLPKRKITIFVISIIFFLVPFVQAFQEVLILDKNIFGQDETKLAFILSDITSSSSINCADCDSRFLNSDGDIGNGNYDFNGNITMDDLDVNGERIKWSLNGAGRYGGITQNSNIGGLFTTDFQTGDSGNVLTTRFIITGGSAPTDFRFFTGNYNNELEIFKIDRSNDYTRILMGNDNPLLAVPFEFKDDQSDHFGTIPLAGYDNYFFEDATEGEAKSIVLFGFTSGGSKESMDMCVGCEANNETTFQGTSDYVFDGNITAHDYLYGSIGFTGNALDQIMKMGNKPSLSDWSEIDHSSYGDAYIIQEKIIPIYNENNTQIGSYVDYADRISLIKLVALQTRAIQQLKEELDNLRLSK